MKPKRTKKVKALTMWADNLDALRPFVSPDKADCTVPVSILPRTKEAAEAMVEQGARALYDLRFPDKSRFFTWAKIRKNTEVAKDAREQARVVLRSLNLISP
jgi:hypothetical protein